MREREWTDQLAGWFAGVRDVPVGIGDDAAVLEFGGRQVAITCDPVVAGVHFEPDADARHVGHKAIGRNLSDLAAMGAEPAFAVVSVLLPAGADREGVFTGLRDAARAAGVQVVGGDVAATPGPLTVTCTVLGWIHGRALLRSGARAGDSLHVTGPLGGSSLGRHLAPRARIVEGRWLAEQPAVVAAIDVSDGLALDGATLARASGGLGLVFDAATIPIHADAVELEARDGVSALEHALSDGEDYELAFVVRAGADLSSDGPLDADAYRPIGRFESDSGYWLDVGGARRPIEPDGYQHEC